MVKSLEPRVSDLEDIIADIPQLLNLRLETIHGAQQEANGRIGLLDKQMSMVLREIRDLRGGVTHQLVEQDKRMAEIQSDVKSLQAAITSVQPDIQGMKSDMKGLQSDLKVILSRLPS